MNAVKYLIDNNVPDVKDFLFVKKKRISYGDLKNAVSRFSLHLNNNGLLKGDRVVIVADNSFEWIITYLGIIASGGVAVPLSPNFIGEQLEYIVEETQSDWIVIDSKPYSNWTGRKTNNVNVILTDRRGSSEPNQRNIDTLEGIINSGEPIKYIKEANVDPETDMAAIMYTSGSTGKPRGVMISHQNIICNTKSIIEVLKLRSSDRMMCVLPFFYCFGTSLLHTHLKAGGSIVIENQFVFPELVLNVMETRACTGLAGVPSNFQILLRKSSLANRDLPSLRYFQQAGGKLSDIFILELKKAVPHAEIFVMYGQTEATARLSCLEPELLDSKLGSIGKGIPGVDLTVVNGGQKAVKPGETGEIVASGKNIALGYWKDTENAKLTFKDGKLFTGDLARVDDDGYIYIVDRAKDFLKCGGIRVSAKYIEDVVLGYPGVVEAAVIGQPDEYLGEAVRLYVVHPDGISIMDELEKYCGNNLDWALVPREIVFYHSLPKNNSGKIDKMVLKEELVD